MVGLGACSKGISKEDPFSASSIATYPKHQSPEKEQEKEEKEEKEEGEEEKEEKEKGKEEEKKDCE